MSELSIIIPIYQTGKYLSKCVDSVLSQTFTDFELILVDDGSTDNSGKICDEYATKDSRIKVIHKQNEGVSVARNTGIAAATGSYITFIDSDDWINPDTYAKIIDAAHSFNSDIVMWDAKTVYANSEFEPDTIVQLPTGTLLSKEDIYPALLLEMAGAAWRCLYKRELLILHNIRFPTGIKLSEDRIFNIYAFGYAKSIYYIKEVFYMRYVRPGSAVNKYYSDALSMALNARNATMTALDLAWDGRSEYKTAYEEQTVSACFAAINNEFYSTAPGSFSQKYNNIKKICNCPELRNAISKLHKTDIRSKLIMCRMYLAVCTMAIILNRKHGR